MTDKELLQDYQQGWKDCLYNKKHLYKNSAYNLGYVHCFMGEDDPYYDYLTDQEILNRIKITRIK